MSPYLQNPLDLGADIVVHSGTKFLCGHSDVTAGVVAVRDRRLSENLYLIQNGEGAVLGPFDAYLLLRGMKTMGIRIDRQQENARRIADYLAGHPRVTRAHYPALAEKAARNIHDRQAHGPGSVLSFQTGSVDGSRNVVQSTRLFGITVRFGSINSSISIPSRMSHASVPGGVRSIAAVPEDLVRVSVGIEDADDLLADLERALAVATPSRDREAAAVL
jgi:cystathionine beta-lyase